MNHATTQSGHSVGEMSQNRVGHFRFRLLIILSVAVIALGAIETHWLIEARRERQAAEIFEQFGGTVHYAWRFDKRIQTTSWRDAGALGWLVPGDVRVDGIYLVGCNEESLDRKLAGLSSFRRLRWVDLADASISDVGLERIARHTHLEWLNLYGTPISDVGLRHLHPSAPLKWLDLGNTLVTDAGLPRLARLKQLETLDLRGTRVSRDALAFLREQLPTATIRTDFDSSSSSRNSSRLF